MRRASAFLLGLGLCGAACGTAADFSPHAVNTQKAGDEPPTAADLVRGITVPEGFRTVLFAAEPDVCQPIAITTDERGRLWVVENYSVHPGFPWVIRAVQRPFTPGGLNCVRRRSLPASSWAL